jgi:hypothetical protein
MIWKENLVGQPIHAQAHSTGYTNDHEIGKVLVTWGTNTSIP